MASEVMKVKLVAGVTNSENDLLAAPSGKTLTILNISLCETGGADETFDLYIRDDAGANDFEIYSDQALGANATFEHTTKFVIEGTDELGFITGGSADVDVVVNYLDQTL